MQQADGIYDILVVGGGINGAGIARDASGRGLKVLLVEKDDLAQHTSSASTKLVHGGLRYLEHYEFRLVREALIERETLLAMAPHIVWPLRFVLPHHKGLRPAWLLRLGLFLYDHIGGRKLLPPTRSVDLREPPHGRILEASLTKGFEYSDCWVEDSRLVALNAMDARARGAVIETRTECVALERQGELWTARLVSEDGERTVRARAIVNAAGPWVDAVLGKALPREEHHNLRLVKGSHIIVPKIYDGAHCYIFQNGDGRIVFAIPYEREFTLLGTTDVAFDGDANEVHISADEARYICEAVNEYLAFDVSPDQAVSSYSGVRPLYDDRSASNSTVTRDYVFELEGGDGEAPILSVFGGKITTFRKLAQHAMEKLETAGIRGATSWDSQAQLPGGDIAATGFDAFYEGCMRRWPWFGPDGILRLARAYGTRIDRILGPATGLQDLGEHYGGTLYEAEVRYLIEEEFARTAEDILWRRSKLGLHLPADAIARLEERFERRQAVSG